jgi:pyrimidine-nucleoside phosphorylase
MQMVQLIEKKRDGSPLTGEEIRWFVQQYTQDAIPDYQVAALLMAIYFQGMGRDEIATLTLAMADSGHRMDLSDIMPYAVDKHSSGGVGDKTTLVVLPLVASFGVPVAKMSGRGLGFSGGTLDKLESIPGFRVDLSEAEFRAIAQRTGLVLCGQTGELAPADGKLYALRDVTGTVPSIPLIASSIMSKKLAAGAQGIVLDVKLGKGAFMPTLEDARRLAEIMVGIGTDAGRDVVALLSDMNQPLGAAVGNALEVREAIACLRGGGAADLRQHCIEIGAYMLRLAGQGQRWQDHAETCALLARHLDDGQALAKFGEMVAAQGGDQRVLDNPDLLPAARYQRRLHAIQTGYIAAVSARSIAEACLALGAGRARKGDRIDLAVGVEIGLKTGDHTEKGQHIATIYANDEARADEAERLIMAALSYSEEPVPPLPLFYDVLSSLGHQGMISQ